MSRNDRGSHEEQQACKLLCATAMRDIRINPTKTRTVYELVDEWGGEWLVTVDRTKAPTRRRRT